MENAGELSFAHIQMRSELTFRLVAAAQPPPETRPREAEKKT
jgi:hypothetical protein